MEGKKNMLILLEHRKEHNKLALVDPHLWHACAGTNFHPPPPNSAVFYFPQGHLEHAHGDINLPNHPCFPPYIPCTVSSVVYAADPATDEVFARLHLSPFSGDLSAFACHENVLVNPPGAGPAPFSVKTLTQSDANNGGGFSVPRYCAETFFPKLDLKADPPTQSLDARDVHGRAWTFRHIYRGTPRRHLLTSGWTEFVNQKRLVMGDSVVFSRSPEGGELRIGIRRGGSCRRTSRARAEDVVRTMSQAARGEEFAVEFYPRSGKPEFVVRAGLVRESMGLRWAEGMRLKMALETQGLTRTSWFVGTVTAVRAADPARWPDSPWRLLQVKWDEPKVLEDMKQVNPWLVEIIPTIDLSPFSPPLKRLRLLQDPDFNPHLPLPEFANSRFLDPNNSLNSHPRDNDPCAGMQGARNAQYGSIPLNLGLTYNILQMNFPPFGLVKPDLDEKVSSPQESKKSYFSLFGQKILIEEPISKSCSSDKNSSSDGNVDESRD